MGLILNLFPFCCSSYKDSLLDKEWEIGAYNDSYEDISSKKVTAKVGLYNIKDLKFSNDLQDFFLINSMGNKVGLYGNETIGSSPMVSQGVRPSICIKNFSPTEGDGTRENPYKVGV